MLGATTKTLEKKRQFRTRPPELKWKRTKKETRIIDTFPTKLLFSGLCSIFFPLTLSLHSRPSFEFVANFSVFDIVCQRMLFYAFELWNPSLQLEEEKKIVQEWMHKTVEKIKKKVVHIYKVLISNGNK